MTCDTPDDAEFKVLVNHEDQYSLCPVKLPIPLGWREAGKQGHREACLEFIRETWTDMRPLSLRLATRQAAGDHAGRAHAHAPSGDGAARHAEAAA